MTGLRDLLIDNSSCFRWFGCLVLSVLWPELAFDSGFVLWFGGWICGFGLWCGFVV